ncbi:hypothetical protein Trisim1_000802 [Trichoderma cf. simile WF8]
MYEELEAIEELEVDEEEDVEREDDDDSDNDSPYREQPPSLMCGSTQPAPKKTMTFLYWAPESIILLDEQGPSNADQMEDEGFRCAVSIFWGKCFHNNNPQNRKKFEKFVDQVRHFF